MKITWDKKFRPDLVAEHPKYGGGFKSFVLVEVHDDDGQGCMVAVNGFTMSITPCKVEDMPPGDTFPEALIPQDVVKAACTLAGGKVATVLIEKGQTTALVDGARYSRPMGDMEFPKWRHLVPGDVQPAENMVIDYRLYATLCKAMGGGGSDFRAFPIFQGTKTGSSTAPSAYVVVTAGETDLENMALGVIMPLFTDREMNLAAIKKMHDSYALGS